MPRVPEMSSRDWQRFWASVEMDGECAVWKPGLTGKPKFSKGRASFTPSIIAYTAQGGTIPQGWFLTRTCRNKRCITPEHAMPRHCTRTLTTNEEYRAHFWSKVNKSGPLPEHVPHLGRCWNWTEGNFSTGYGQFWYRGISRNAHRMAYTFEVGEIPEGLVIDHMCHNPRCVRPDHLRPIEAWQNASNRGPAVYLGETGFRGVSKSWSRFKAEARVKNRKHYLGTYATPEEAHRAVSAFRRDRIPTNILDQQEVIA